MNLLIYYDKALVKVKMKFKKIQPTRLIIQLLILTVTFLFPLLTQAMEAVVEHQLNVRLDPENHQLFVEDKITLPAKAPREIHFSLHTGMQPEILNDDITLIPLEVSANSLQQQFKLRLPDKTKSFTLQYNGIINHSVGKRQQAGAIQSSAGLISTDGVFLTGGTNWFAQFEHYPYLRFTLSVQSPAGWKVISQGKRVQHETIKGVAVDQWNSASPQEEIYLIAAKFSEYNLSVDGINAQVFLRQPDEKLAEKYLQATIRYISMYEKLLGDYPYAKFALVENFWETGFGMPSFTLLGSRVIRFPFILYSSYPHEILHNWWGNGVYVDFETGNWSEGLTAYLADHLIKQQQGKGTDYRLQTLQKYTDYAGKERDFPLTRFRGRHSSASAAVGYGKTLMFFHMLRVQLGDALFTQALRQFYQQHQFKAASFEDLQKTFEQVSGENLSTFFDQWVNRTGAPELTLGQSSVTQKADGFHLSFSLNQLQPGDSYQLKVPLAITLEGETETQQVFITMTQKNQQFELTFKTPPLRLDIDPEFDLFRKLATDETPPAFTQLLGSNNMLIILPRSADPELKSAWQTFAQSLAQMGPETVQIKWDDELEQLPEDQAITILGWKNRFADEILTLLTDFNVTSKPDKLTIQNVDIPRLNYSVAFTTRSRNINNYPRAFIATDLAGSLNTLARKLPHYHKYSYLAFSGSQVTNKLKGRWSIEQSPMTILFDDKIKRGTLAIRPALTTLISN